MNENKVIRREACWALSNIMAGNQSQAKLCIDNGLSLKILEILSYETEPLVLTEAVWCIANQVRTL